MIAAMSLVRIGGLQVETAASGLEALEKAARAAPDLIVLDVMMPHLDGPGTLERLQSGPAASVPVVFMTAKAQQPEIAAYLALGAIGVVVKPFDPLTLPTELARLYAGTRGGASSV